MEMSPPPPVLPSAPEVRGIWAMRVRKAVLGMHAGLALLLALALWGLANHAARRHHARTNISSSLFYQLSERTRALLATLDTEVTVALVMSRDHGLFLECEGLLREYAGASGLIRLEILDPNTDTARVKQLVEAFSLPTDEKAFVLWHEGTRARRVIRGSELTADDPTAPVPPPLPDGSAAPVSKVFRGEAEFTAALAHVIHPSSPVVYFLQGHGERGVDDFEPNRGYAEVRKLLEMDNFRVRPLRMDEDAGVPPDCAALVVAGPKFRLAQPEVDLIRDYLARRNGRMMVLLDRMTETGLEPLLEQWGVKVGNDMVVDSRRTLDGSQLVVSRYADHPVTQGLEGVMSIFFLPRSVDSTGKSSNGRTRPEDRPRFTQLASSSKYGWGETDLVTHPIRFDPDQDTQGPVCIAGAVEVGPDTPSVSVSPTRLVVIGDSQFVANRPLSGGGMRLFLNAIRWLADAGGRPAGLPGKPIQVQRLELERKDMSFLFISLVGVLPGAVAFTGILVWIRRRR